MLFCVGFHLTTPSSFSLIEMFIPYVLNYYNRTTADLCLGGVVWLEQDVCSSAYAMLFCVGFHLTTPSSFSLTEMFIPWCPELLQQDNSWSLSWGSCMAGTSCLLFSLCCQTVYQLVILYFNPPMTYEPYAQANLACHYTLWSVGNHVYLSHLKFCVCQG